MAHELFRCINSDVTIDLSCKIYLVGCHVDRRGLTPFLLFLFEKEKEKENGPLAFPSVNGPAINMREICKTTFPEYKEVDYIGYVMFGKEIYAFVNIIDVQISVELTSSNNRWMCLVDEIINYQSVMQFKISRTCTAFLFSNVYYYTLYSGKKPVEIPYVAYVTSNNAKQTELDHYFGLSKTNYEWYIFESCDDFIDKCGIIRYAVFDTTPKTLNGKTRWFVRTLDSVVSLSYHRKIISY